MAMMMARMTREILRIFSISFRRWIAARLFCLNRLLPSFLWW